MTPEEQLEAALTEVLVKALARTTALPEWMQLPALGRDMRPLAEYLAEPLAVVMLLPEDPE